MSRLNGPLRVLTLRCEEASALLSYELDDSLPRLDRVALLCHLLVCRSCRRFRADPLASQGTPPPCAAPLRNGLARGLDSPPRPSPHRQGVPTGCPRRCRRRHMFE